MSTLATTNTLVHGVTLAAGEAIGTAMSWCELMTDTQRLLLPTSVLVVVLLWTKMCPSQPRLPAAREGDEDLYAAAAARWAASKHLIRPRDHA
jgi:hypothetical protein